VHRLSKEERKCIVLIGNQPLRATLPQGQVVPVLS
jgi:hypothetical protein